MRHRVGYRIVKSYTSKRQKGRMHLVGDTKFLLPTAACRHKKARSNNNMKIQYVNIKYLF